MTRHVPPLITRLAQEAGDVTAARRLRYEVFVEEMGVAGGSGTDRGQRVEGDALDAHCDHLLLVDPMAGGEVVGTTRLMGHDAAARAGRFATEAEFDIDPLRRSGQSLLEVGRTCLHPRVRGGSALHALWLGIQGYAMRQGAEIVFGLASLPLGDPAETAAVVEALGYRHLAPPSLRPRSLAPVALPAPAALDRRSVMLRIPPLVKAYLRLGGVVGEGAFLDPAFGCIDLCMVLPAARLTPTGQDLLRRGPA